MGGRLAWSPRSLGRLVEKGAVHCFDSWVTVLHLKRLCRPVNKLSEEGRMDSPHWWCRLQTNICPVDGHPQGEVARVLGRWVMPGRSQMGWVAERFRRPSSSDC